MILVKNMGQICRFLKNYCSYVEFSPYFCSAFKIKTGGPLGDQMLMFNF